jgi:hypothetical protein
MQPDCSVGMYGCIISWYTIKYVLTSPLKAKFFLCCIFLSTFTIPKPNQFEFRFFVPITFVVYTGMPKENCGKIYDVYHRHKLFVLSDSFRLFPTTAFDVWYPQKCISLTINIATAKNIRTTYPFWKKKVLFINSDRQ